MNTKEQKEYSVELTQENFASVLPQETVDTKLLNNYQEVPRFGEKSKELLDNIEKIKSKMKDNLIGLNYSVSMLITKSLISDLESESMKFILQ